MLYTKGPTGPFVLRYNDGMDKTLILLVVVALIGVGVYFGLSSLLTQYAVVPGGSNANQYACAPATASAKINTTVRFNSSIPEGIPYYWSAPDATASFVVSGPLDVKYGRAGTKTAYLFYVINNSWYRTSCTIQIK